MITRAEYIVLIILLVICLIPLIQEGGLLRLLYEGIDSSSIDPGVLASLRLGMILIMVIALVKILKGRK